MNQARRIRDYWAGSFLLSFLTLVIAQELKRRKANILLPGIPDHLLDLLAGNGQAVRDLGLPNRITAKLPDGADPQEIADACVMKLRTVWKELAELVWKNDLAHISSPDTRKIFERQVKDFWDVQYVVSESAAEPVLDMRKNWRMHYRSDEPGVKCALIAGLQELSGTKTDSAALRDFWAKLKKTIDRYGYDLQEGEHLSAIAFIKRRFVHYFDQLKIEQVDMVVRGWTLEFQAPSPASLAAVPLLRRGLELVGDSGDFSDLRAAAKNHGSFKGVNAELAYDDAPGADEDEGTKQFRSRLRAFVDAARAKDGRFPAMPDRYHALLVMDGDRMGALLAKGDATAQGSLLTSCLDAFTGKVPEIVQKHDGFLVYAGGDDVLALLPKSSALDCAARLRETYNQAFAAKGVTATISAGIVYAGIKEPLGHVIRKGHEILDTRAKDLANRDALAISVLKGGSENLSWTVRWNDLPLSGNRSMVNELAARLSPEGDISSGLVYRLRELVGKMAPVGEEPPPGQIDELLQGLFKAEILQSQSGNRLSSSAASEEARKMVRLCSCGVTGSNYRYDAAPLMYARFISSSVEAG